MRFIPLIAAFFILAFAAPALATDLFVKQPPAANGTTAPNVYTPAPAQPAPQAQPQAQTPPPPQEETISSFAARYYKNCMAKQDPILKNENQQMLCTCSSQKLMDQMTVDDIKTMATDTPEGQFQRNRMLLNVYAPCMEYPARAILVANCESDPNIQKTVPNYQAVCSCMGDSMGRYIAKNGQSVIAQSLQKNPNDLNPLASLMNSPEFQATAQAKLTACVAAAAAGTGAPPAQDPAP